MSEREKRFQQIIDAGIPMIERELGRDKAAIFESRAWQHYVPLAAQAPSFEQRINSQLFALGVPMLALYRTLRVDFGMAKEPALHLLDEMLSSAYRAILDSPVMAAAVNVVYRVGFIRNRVMKRAFDANEPHGFRFERVDDPDAVFALDVRECALVKYATAQGAPEIVPLICRIDDLVSERLRGITLKRTGTISTGAERCDFRYVRK
jgi:hypothetical protein